MQQIQTVLETSAKIWGISYDDAARLLSSQRRKAVRVNTLKARKSTFARLLEDGIELQQFGWAPHCYAVTKGYEKLSTHQAVAAGEIFMQNAASFVPVLALDPHPGEHILDMAAAPGGKTSHIAAITKNKAHIVANDASKVRFFKMREIFTLLGVKAETVLHDGRNARQAFGNRLFDRILLDAPCSGEAAINPNEPKSYAAWTPGKVKRLSRLQEQLLINAYDCLKVGGTLVYSTCTINPEENEFVVARLLKRRGAVLETITQVPADARPGLTVWQDKTLPQELHACVRLMPSLEHEAFFVAKIRKSSRQSVDAYYV